MPDIFDEVAKTSSKGDIFDEVAAEKPPAKTVGGFARNIGSSTAAYVGGVGSALRHPVHTLESIGDLAHGGIIKGLQAVGVPGQLDADEQRKVAAVDAIGQRYKDRYGSAAKVGETLYQDPVGVAADASMVLGGVGAGLKAAQLPRAAKWASTASQTTNPLVGPVRLAKTAVRSAVPNATLNNMAIKQYEGALKPPPSWNSVDDTRTMIETGMDEGVKLPFIGTGTGAIKKTQGKIDAINQEVAAKVKLGAAQGMTADPAKVVNETGRTFLKVDDFANPRSAKSMVGNMTREFLEEHAGATPKNPAGNPIPLDRAQAIKSGTYKQIRDANFGEFKTVEKEVLKDLARGLKNEVYSAYPELKALGMKEQALIDLEDSLERFALRQGNRDNMQLGSLAAGAVGGKVGLLAKAAMDNPGVKSRIAIALRKASKLPAISPAKPARFRQAINTSSISGPKSLEDE